MLIPANFAIGALVGAAASYVYKDDAAKEALANLSSKVKSGVNSTLGLLKKEPVTDAEEATVAESAGAEYDAAGVEEAEVIAEEKSDKA